MDSPLCARANQTQFPDTDLVWLKKMYITHVEELGGYDELASRSEFDFLDRSSDPALDELTGVAAALCGADFAYIGWMDKNRLWFKSRHGFQAPEQIRTQSACHWMLEDNAPMLIRDAGKDSRFPPRGIEIEEGKRCLSYAGVPLVNAALEVVGTLAVLSEAPDQFSEQHLHLLDILGR